VHLFVGLLPPPIGPIWCAAEQARKGSTSSGLSFGEGIVAGLWIIATFALCAASIWVKRRVCSRKSNDQVEFQEGSEAE